MYLLNENKLLFSELTLLYNKFISNLALDTSLCLDLIVIYTF